jgi:hypothetical protein
MLWVMSAQWGPVRWLFITPPALFGVGLGAVLFAPPKVGRLELTAEGLAYGRPGALRLVPWQDVRFARPHIVQQIGAPPRTVAITVGFADGGAVTLPDIFEKPLDELATLIEPSLSVVAAAARDPSSAPNDPNDDGP